MSQYTLTELDYVAALKVKRVLSAAKRWLEKNPPPADWKRGKYAYAYENMPVFPWTIRDRCIYQERGARVIKQVEPVEASAVSEVTE